jgi:hypothetical protein
MKSTEAPVVSLQGSIEHLSGMVLPNCDRRSYQIQYNDKGNTQTCHVTETERKNVFLSFSRERFLQVFHSFHSFRILQAMRSFWHRFVTTDSMFIKKYNLANHVTQQSLFEEVDDLGGFRSFFRTYISIDKGYNLPVLRFVFSSGDEFHIFKTEDGTFSLACFFFSKILKENHYDTSPLSEMAKREQHDSGVTGQVVLVALDDFPYGRKKWRRERVFLSDSNPESVAAFKKYCSQNLMFLQKKESAIGGHLFDLSFTQDKEDDLFKRFPWLTYCIVKQNIIN